MASAADMVSITCNTNVFGACAHSGLLYYMNIHGKKDNVWIFYQDLAMLVLCMLIQCSFVFWVWNCIDFSKASKSCSVHPVANLASVAVLVTSSVGTMRSCVLHSRIILSAENYAVSKDGKAIEGSQKAIVCTNFQRALIFGLAVFTELMILIFYLPLGVIYVLLQGSPEQTVMASVAMNFILEIDEILFDKFAGQWRTVQIKRNPFQLPKTSRECSSVQQLAMASLKNSQDLKNCEDAPMDEVTAKTLQHLFSRDLLLAVVFTFGIVFGIREQLLFCSSVIGAPPNHAPNATEDTYNSSATPATPAHDARSQVPPPPNRRPAPA